MTAKSDRLRILHIVEAAGGGISAHLRTIASSQSRRGHAVAVALPSERAKGLGDARLPCALRANGVDVDIIPFRPIPFHPANIAASRKLRELIDRWSPDLLHTHSTTAGVIGRLIAWRSRKPLVHTPNGVHFADDRLTPSSLGALGLERLLAPLTSRVIAVSESELPVLARAYPKAKITVIPNGLDPVDEAPPPFPDKPRIVAVTRLAYPKHPELTVRVLALARRANPDVEAVIVGDGHLEQRVKKLIAESDPRIRLAGRVDGLEAMRESTAVLLTSRWEGGPYAPLEAMALGRPVVATDVVGSRDVVVHGQTGYLFPPSQPDLGAAHLVGLVADRNRARQLGEAGRVRLLEKYSVDRMVARLIDTYGVVLSEHSTDLQRPHRRRRWIDWNGVRSADGG